MIDRRTLLYSGGATAALLGTVGFGTRKSYGQEPDIYGMSTSIAALTSGNVLQSSSSSLDWTALQNSLSAVRDHWQANNYDGQLQGYYSNLNPSILKSSNLDQGQILQKIQATNPDVTLGMLQGFWAPYDNMAPSDVQSVIDGIRNYGLIPQINSAIDYAQIFGQQADAPTPPPPDPPMDQQADPNWVRALPPPPSEGGGGTGYCENASFAVDFIGLAFLTIGIMSGVGVIVEGAAWGLIAAWGGGTATAYGIANRWLCRH